MQSTKTKTFWITGKGGVGKSTVCFLLAEKASKMGKSALVIENCHIPSAKEFFGVNPKHEPVLAKSNLFVSNIDQGKCFESAFSIVLGSKNLSNILLKANMIQKFLAAAPGSQDIAWLHRVHDLAYTGNYDYIFVDMASFGHAFSQLNITDIGLLLFRSGPIHKMLIDIQEWLRDPSKSELLMVTIPEELPSLETLDFFQKFEKLQIPMKSIIMNQVLWPSLEIKNSETWGKDLEIPENAQRLFEVRALKKHFGDKMKDLLSEKLPLNLAVLPFSIQGDPSKSGSTSLDTLLSWSEYFEFSLP